MRNKYKIIYVCLLVLLCLIASCVRQDEKVEEALSLAGENRVELEEVLNYYKNDSLKLEAARFLIGNMPGAYGIDSQALVDCRAFYENYDSLSREYGYVITTEWGQKVDSLWKNFSEKQRVRQAVCNDIEVMTAGQLINEIELAFEAWKSNAYSQNGSFENFCEYVLPYRRLNGLAIDNARQEFYQRHHKNYFVNKEKGWQQEVDSLLYEYKHLTHSGFWGTQIPLWSAGAFEELRHGLCMQRCWYNSLLLSSLGMPVAIDFVPAWGNRNNSHTWNVVLLEGQSYAFEAFWDDDRWKYKRIYNNRTKDGLWGKFRLPKVYRYTYSNHIEELLADREVDRTDIPALFCNIKMRDVSSEYFETADVAVELTKDMPEGAKYAYLAVWGYQDWHPVQWGKIENGKAAFRGMGKDIVYLPVYYKKGAVIPAASPFWLKEDGQIEKLCGGKAKEHVTVRLVTGAPAYDKNREYLGSMQGLRVIGMVAGKSEQELCVWTDSMSLERTLKPVCTNKTVRYVRLQLPSDSIALGELAFYTKEGRIDNIKVTTSLKTVRSNETKEMLTDGIDATAYCGRVPNGLVDIDLGNEYRITVIALAPYLKMELFPPDEFELYFWKDEWVSLGRKPGNNSGYLEFDNVPQGALLMLKNCRWEGKSSERIFVYEDGVVLWQ
ncbi:hypothetical protein [Bacteroides sp.]